MGLHTDAVPRAVNEVSPKAGIGNDAASGAVDVLAIGADNTRCDPCGLGLVQHCVRLGHRRLRLAQRDTAGDVAAVASHRAAEVAQYEVAHSNHPLAGVMVRRSSVRSCGNDRKVDDVVAFGQQPRRDIGADCGLRAPDQLDLAALQLRCHTIGCGTGRLQCCDLGSIFAHAQFVHHDGAAHVARCVRGPMPEQLDKEACPHRVAYRRHPRSPNESRHDRNRIVGFVPRAHTEHIGVFVHPRRLQARDHQRRFAIAGHDQHRQPLERHRLVAGEVRQVAANRDQQQIDIRGRHAGPRSADAVEEHV